MTNNQEDKHTRNKTVDKAQDMNAGVFAGVPLFVTLAGNLKLKIAEIDGYIIVQLQDLKGYAKDKQKFEVLAIEKVMVLDGPMKAWARSNNDNTFFESVNYTKSKLDDQRDTILGDTLTFLNTKANDNIAALAAAGLTPAMVTESVTATATYIAYETAPRNAVGARANATALIKVAMKQADVIIEQIRNLTEQYKTTNPTFYNTMQSALGIVNTGGHTGGTGTGGNVVEDLMLDILPNSYMNEDLGGHVLHGTSKIIVTINATGEDLGFGFGANETSIDSELTAGRGMTTTKTFTEAGFSATNKFLNFHNPTGNTVTFHLQILRK